MKRVIRALTRLCESYLPDAFVFSLLLTLIVFAAALVLTSHGPMQLLEFWGKDFWSLNAFAMQMIFVLVSGSMLATTPVVKKLLTKLSSFASCESSALVMLSLFSIITCWINWGFGLIVSGIFALELARKLGKVNFGLFMATGYSGFLVWHGGLSGSIPLKIAGEDEILNQIYPGLKIPLTDTIFSSHNITILLALTLLLPMVAWAMQTPLKQVIDLPPDEKGPVVVKANLRDQLEHSPWLNILFFIFFMLLMVQGLIRGESFDINRVNFIFLFSAILLHGTPYRFLQALKNTFANASGIAIQFPFYAGIMGVMQYSGLADVISELFVAISTPQNLPMLAFLSGGMVNFFVPSGGGQWVVQGPVMLKAAKELGVDPARVAMALAWGDAWTNMIQPFWALPLLALAQLQLKDIMGYCLVYLLVSGLLISSLLYFF